MSSEGCSSRNLAKTRDGNVDISEKMSLRTVCSQCIKQFMQEQSASFTIRSLYGEASLSPLLEGACNRPAISAKQMITS